MRGHYLRVQDAAELLGVSPATIRWYSLQGWLPTYRVGRGQVAHRRFRYADVKVLAERTGRFIPDEPRWDSSTAIDLDMAAQYLGLSPRYLVDGGWLKPGDQLGWDDLVRLERKIYPAPEPLEWMAGDEKKEGLPMMSSAAERGCGCGPRAMKGMHGPMRGHGPKWGLSEPGENASLLALRRAKRHLEVEKADLEDQIAEIDRRIAQHPDNQA